MNSELKLNERKKLEKAYDSHPMWYDIRGFFILTFSYNDTLWGQVSFFCKNLSQNHLEAAIGTGTLTSIMNLWNRWVLRKGSIKGIGFDYSAYMLSGAQHKFSSSFQLVQADIRYLNFENDQFDSVNLANSLHCLPDIDKALSELFRVLKKDRFFYTNVLLYPNTDTFFGRVADSINKWGIKKGILVTPYHEEDIIKKLNQAGFQLIEKYKSGNSLNLILRK